MAWWEPYVLSRHWLLAIICLYLLIELWRYLRFRRLLRRLRARRYERCGDRSFLAWSLQLLQDPEAPLSLDADVFARYAAEGEVPSIGYGGGRLAWPRLYAWWAWGCGRPFDVRHDAELHAQLLGCTAACCRRLGLEPPPTGAPPPAELALPPFGYGVSDVRATFKPMPLRFVLRAVLLASRGALLAMGFQRVTEPMLEGDLVCWVDPRAMACASGRGGCRSDQVPVVFLHGLGLGNFTYLPLFMGQHGAAWRRGGCILVELPCMTSAWRVLERMPQAVHYADALGRLLTQRLGCCEFGYDIVCHSLSAYLAAMLCNDGSPCRPRRTVLIDPVCFLEGVEVCSRFPFRTPEECRAFAEKTVLFPSFLPWPLRRLLGQTFRQLVCRDIFTQYSVMRWIGANATSVLWRSKSAEALVCLSDADHFVPSERVARHCAVHFPQLKVFRMPGKDHGSFVIESDLRQQLLARMADFLTCGK